MKSQASEPVELIVPEQRVIPEPDIVRFQVTVADSLGCNPLAANRTRAPGGLVDGLSETPASTRIAPYARALLVTP